MLLLPWITGCVSLVRWNARLARWLLVMFQSSLTSERLLSRSTPPPRKSPGCRPSAFAALITRCRSLGEILLLVEAPVSELSRPFAESLPRPTVFCFS